MLCHAIIGDKKSEANLSSRRDNKRMKSYPIENT